MALDFITASKVSINTGDKQVTVNGYVDFSPITKGDLLIINKAHLVPLESGSTFSEEGISTFTLDTVWEGENVESVSILIFPTFQDTKTTVEAMRRLGILTREMMNRLQDEGRVRTSNISMHHIGKLKVMPSTSKWHAPHTITIIKIEAYLDVAPTDSDVVLALKSNGELLTTITISQDSTQEIQEGLELVIEQYQALSVDILAVGTSKPGQNLTLRLTY